MGTAGIQIAGVRTMGEYVRARRPKRSDGGDESRDRKRSTRTQIWLVSPSLQLEQKSRGKTSVRDPTLRSVHQSRVTSARACIRSSPCRSICTGTTARSWESCLRIQTGCSNGVRVAACPTTRTSCVPTVQRGSVQAHLMRTKRSSGWTSRSLSSRSSAVGIRALPACCGQAPSRSRNPQLPSFMVSQVRHAPSVDGGSEGVTPDGPEGCDGDDQQRRGDRDSAQYLRAVTLRERPCTDDSRDASRPPPDWGFVAPLRMPPVTPVHGWACARKPRTHSHDDTGRQGERRNRDDRRDHSAERGGAMSRPTAASTKVPRERNALSVAVALRPSRRTIRAARRRAGHWANPRPPITKGIARVVPGGSRSDHPLWPPSVDTSVLVPSSAVLNGLTSHPDT